MAIALAIISMSNFPLDVRPMSDNNQNSTISMEIVFSDSYQKSGHRTTSRIKEQFPYRIYLEHPYDHQSRHYEKCLTTRPEEPRVGLTNNVVARDGTTCMSSTGADSILAKLFFTLTGKCSSIGLSTLKLGHAMNWSVMF